jgi:hypothetical protein
MSVDPLEYELTDHDRRALRDMARGPGYAVLRRIWKAYLDATIESAERASRIDPLANRDSIATRWAYVAITEQTLESLKSGIDFELSLLSAKEAPPASPEELAARRRRLVLGFLDPLPGSPGEARTGADEMGVAE